MVWNIWIIFPNQIGDDNDDPIWLSYFSGGWNYQIDMIASFADLCLSLQKLLVLPGASGWCRGAMAPRRAEDLPSTFCHSPHIPIESDVYIYIFRLIIWYRLNDWYFLNGDFRRTSGFGKKRPWIQPSQTASVDPTGEAAAKWWRPERWRDEGILMLH